MGSAPWLVLQRLPQDTVLFLFPVVDTLSFSDSLHCVINCWCREGMWGSVSYGLVMVHCPKVGSSWYAWILTWQAAVSRIYVYFLPLPGSSLFMFMHYLLEMVLRSLFSFVKGSCTEETLSWSKQKTWIQGFWLAFPLSCLLRTLFF